MRFFIDLSEFFARPHRSGIQRVGRELCRCWPGGDLNAACLYDGRLVEFPSEALLLVDEYFEASSESVERLGSEIVSLAGRPGPAVALDDPDTRVIVSEVFYDDARMRFYRSLPRAVLDRVYFIVHDLLPLTNPELFPPDIAYQQIWPYFRLLLDVPNRAFDSHTTRTIFFERFARRPANSDPVLRLGSDSLRGSAREHPPSSPRFSMIGTVEPRKRHITALQAFESLLPEVPGLTLDFFGRLGWVSADTERYLRDAQKKYSSFQWFEDAGDAVIANGVANSQATLFLSTAEGYGLPPVESLYLGVPVIAAGETPSLEDIRSGVRFVDELTVDGVRTAMKDLCNPVCHARLAGEARSLELPTWSSWAVRVREWVSG